MYNVSHKVVIENTLLEMFDFKICIYTKAYWVYFYVCFFLKVKWPNKSMTYFYFLTN